MATKEEREVAKKIRGAVKPVYDFWASYNDKNKDGRRIKMMRNGFDFGDKEYKRMDAVIKKNLAEAGVVYKTAGFEECERDGYSEYQAYIVRL